MTTPVYEYPCFAEKWNSKECISQDGNLSKSNVHNKYDQEHGIRNSPGIKKGPSQKEKAA